MQIRSVNSEIPVLKVTDAALLHQRQFQMTTDHLTVTKSRSCLGVLGNAFLSFFKWLFDCFCCCFSPKKQSMETSTPKPEEIIDDCIICQDKVTVPVDTPCKHGPFDLHCLNNWLEQQRTCPICIQDILNNSFIDRPDLLKQPVTLQISYSKNKSVMLKVAPEATIDTVKFATCRQIDKHVSYKDTNLYANLFDMKKNKLDPKKSLQDYKMTAEETYPLSLEQNFIY